MGQHEGHDHEPHRELTVETLSTPPLRVKPAPLGLRLAAGIIDSTIVALIWASLGIGFHQDVTPTAQDPLWLASLALITFVYYFILEWVFSASIGKRLLKLVVLSKDGDPCSLDASLKRNLLRFLDWLPICYAAAIIVIIVSSDRQRIGDLIARTIVTRAPEKDINPPPAPFLFH
jgi:uncharacterized RDD family membrane protein YckC